MKSVDDILNSGILELYVAGVLPEAEKAEVESYIQKYPEVKAEIDNISSVVYTLTSSYSKKAPESLKASIQSQIKSPEVININRGKEKIYNKQDYKWLAAAAIALLVISAAMNFYFYNQWNDAERNLIALQQEKDLFATDLVKLSDSLTNIQQQIAVITDPQYKPVLLKGLDVSPQSSAIVYWNIATNESFINIKSLPAPPAGKQYQLWAIADGQPVDAGVFDVHKDSILQPMKAVKSAQAWAVTLEPAGGSINPTLDAMYLYSGS